MKIKEMNLTEVKNAIKYMSTVPVKDPNYSGWNFDESEYKDKLKELNTQLELLCQ